MTMETTQDQDQDFEAMVAGTTVEAPVVQMGDGLPRVWWRNGESEKKREPGFFYTDDSQFPDGLGSPWVQQDVYPDNPEKGYVALRLGIAIIGYRWNAFRKVGAGKAATKVWLERYEPGATIQTDILCYVRGTPEGQLCVLSVKGLTGKALTAKGQILDTYRAGFLKAASARAGRKLPDWAFWLPLATQVDVKGQPAYLDTGHESKYTPPALYIPEGGPGKKDPMSVLFVGQALLTMGRTEWDGNQDWLAEKFYMTRGQADQGGGSQGVDFGKLLRDRRGGQGGPEDPPAFNDEDVPF